MQSLFMVGWISGVLIRTIAPYLLRVFKGELAFDWQYLRAAVTSILTGVLTDALIMPQTGVIYTSPWDAIWAGLTAGFIVQTAVQWKLKELK